MPHKPEQLPFIENEENVKRLKKANDKAHHGNPLTIEVPGMIKTKALVIMALVIAAGTSGSALAQSKKGTLTRYTVGALGETRDEFFASGQAATMLAACKAEDYKTAFPDDFSPEISCKEMILASTGATKKIGDTDYTIQVNSYRTRTGTTYNEYKFEDGKFVYFSIHIGGNPLGNGQDFDMWSEPNVRLYGAPTLKQIKKYQNGFGATFEGRTWVWAGKTTMLAVEELPGPDGEVITWAALQSYLEKHKPEAPPADPPAKLP
ncbi:MAG: hypothetical protein ACLP3K_05645 [Candidatus Acidiferrales bacterium]